MLRGAAQMPWTTRFNPSSSVSWTSRRKDRTPPARYAVSGITLKASPAWLIVTETTARRRGSTFRDTSVCKPSTTWDAATIGSMPLCGQAPWVPRPRISISN